MCAVSGCAARNSAASPPPPPTVAAPADDDDDPDGADCIDAAEDTGDAARVGLPPRASMDSAAAAEETAGPNSAGTAVKAVSTRESAPLLPQAPLQRIVILRSQTWSESTAGAPWTGSLLMPVLFTATGAVAGRGWPLRRF